LVAGGFGFATFFFAASSEARRHPPQCFWRGAEGVPPTAYFTCPRKRVNSSLWAGGQFLHTLAERATRTLESGHVVAQALKSSWIRTLPPLPPPNQNTSYSASRGWAVEFETRTQVFRRVVQLRDRFQQRCLQIAADGLHVRQASVAWSSPSVSISRCASLRDRLHALCRLLNCSTMPFSSSPHDAYATRRWRRPVLRPRRCRRKHSRKPSEVKTKQKVTEREYSASST